MLSKNIYSTCSVIYSHIVTLNKNRMLQCTLTNSYSCNFRGNRRDKQIYMKCNSSYYMISCHFTKLSLFVLQLQLLGLKANPPYRNVRHSYYPTVTTWSAKNPFCLFSVKTKTVKRIWPCIFIMSPTFGYCHLSSKATQPPWHCTQYAIIYQSINLEWRQTDG